MLYVFVPASFVVWKQWVLRRWKKKILVVENNILKRMAGKWRVDSVFMEGIKEDELGTLSDRLVNTHLRWAWTYNKNGRRMTRRESMGGRRQQEKV